MFDDARRIRRSLIDRPEEWDPCLSGYTIRHVPTGYEIWTSSGFWFLGRWGGRRSESYNLIEKLIVARPALKLYRAHKRKEKVKQKREAAFKG